MLCFLWEYLHNPQLKWTLTPKFIFPFSTSAQWFDLVLIPQEHSYQNSTAVYEFPSVQHQQNQSRAVFEGPHRAVLESMGDVGFGTCQARLDKSKSGLLERLGGGWRRDMLQSKAEQKGNWVRMAEWPFFEGVGKKSWLIYLSVWTSSVSPCSL